MYGDGDDVFIDHAIDRAPGFHSVAKLKTVPDFWKGQGYERIVVPSKTIRDLPTHVLDRGALVDNAFTIYWLPPVGLLRPAPQDPLRTRDGSAARYEIQRVECGTKDMMEISRFLHFDVKLLNYGVLIV